MFRLACVLLLIFLIVPSASNAEEGGTFISASYLYQMCSRNQDGTEKVKGAHTACQAYISGVIDYHNLLRSLKTAPSVDICVPNTTPLTELQDIVWTYLHVNGQHDAFAAAPAVTLALSTKYPCPKK